MLKTKLYYLFWIIPIPVFFTTTGVFRGSSLGEDTFALPIALFVYIFIFSFNRRYILILLKKENVLLPVLLLYSIIIFLLKIIFSGSSFNPNLLFISVIPFVLSFSVGYSINSRLLDINLTKVVNKAIFVFTIFCLAHLLSSFLSFGLVGTFANRGEDSVFGLFSIYQKFVYYPTMTACFFVMSLFTTLKCKYIYSMILLLVIFMTGAREAILISFIGILFIIIINMRRISGLKILKFSFVFIILLGLINYYSDEINEALETATFLSKIRNLGESNDLTAGRSGAIHEVFNNSWRDFNLLIGTGYSMNLGDFRSPHNQYAEILLRSGIIGLGIFMIIIFGTLCKMLRYVKYYKCTKIRNNIYSFVLVYLCLIIVSFNVNVPVRAPYTALLFGFLTGFFNNLILKSKGEKLDIV